MYMRKGALGTRVISAVLATTLAVTLLPTAGLAFAAEPADNAAEAEQTEGELAQSEASATVEQPAGEAMPAEAESAPIAPEPEPAAEPATAPVAATAGQAVYTSTSAERISVDVPATASGTTVGDIEYHGLTYRINPDGATASLIGLGVTEPAATLQVPARIATADATYTVVNCSIKLHSH